MARKVRPWGVSPYFFVKSLILKEFRRRLCKSVIAKGFRLAPYKSLILQCLILIGGPRNFAAPFPTPPIPGMGPMR